jgi:hypothetical protein
MLGRVLIGGAAVTAMLAVLAVPTARTRATPGDAAGATSPPATPVLAPWRPTLALRFTGAMTALDQHVLDSHDRAGFVTATVGASGSSSLNEIRADAARATRWIAQTCRCKVRGYRIVVRAPARPLAVIDSRRP